MELSCEKEVISFLEPAVVEPQSIELSQEVRLSDGMPDVEKILGVWGQPVVRSHRWQSAEVVASGGVMAWVLYRGSDGSLQCLDSWVSFSTAWDLPPDCPEGVFSVGVCLRFADGRSVSARRIGLRFGVGLTPTAFRYRHEEIPKWEEIPGVEVLKNTYPMRFLKEAGEKHFSLEEDLPISAGSPKRMLSASVTPSCTDCRVLGEKLAFRGNANLHVLYEGENGAVFAEDYPVGFSQFAELDELYGTDAQASVNLLPESMEADVQEGMLHAKLTFCAGYTLSDVTELVLAGDAYAPGGELKVQMQSLPLPSVLDCYTKTAELDKGLASEIKNIAEVTLLCDAPVRKTVDGEMLLRGSVQVLGTDAEGMLCSATARWEQSVPCGAAMSARMICVCNEPPALRTDMASEVVNVHVTLNLSCCALCAEGYESIAAMELLEQTQTKTMPSLILSRFSGNLWDTAKHCHSRVEDIKRVNHLEGDPKPGRMLLIPVCGYGRL